jgi:hypothetical protein
VPIDLTLAESKRQMQEATTIPCQARGRAALQRRVNGLIKARIYLPRPQERRNIHPMLRPDKWLWNRLKTFDYLWAYITAAYDHFGDIIWGVAVVGVVGGIPFLVWGIITQFHDIQAWKSWLALLAASILSGYYVWRAYHIRLIPQLEIEEDAHVTRVPDFIPTQKFVQITAKCKTEGAVTDCRGQLLRVMTWSTRQEKWEATQIDGTIDLLWAELDLPSVTLEPGAPRRLVVFEIQRNNWQIIVWDEKRFTRLPLTYAPNRVLRFDLRVGRPGYKAEFISIRVAFGQEWGAMEIEKIANEN